MSCKVTSPPPTPIIKKEDPREVQEYNQHKLEQPMEQPDKNIVFIMKKGNRHYPVFNRTRLEASQLIARHKDFILFIKIDQQTCHEITDYRVTCLSVSWSHKDNKAFIDVVLEQHSNVTLHPDCGIKPLKVMMTLHIEDAYRQRSSYIFPRNPIKSYWVGGHGKQIRPSVDKQEDGYFIVPNDCIIIVKAHSGSITYASPTYKYFKKLIQMADGTKYPFQIKNNLIKKLGSVAIYGPGDTCPEFMYTLHSKLKSGRRVPYESGIIDFDCHKDMKKLPSLFADAIQMDITMSQTITNIEQWIAYYLQQYQWSIYPSQDDIRMIVDEQLQSINNTTNGSIIKKLEPLISDALDGIKIKQSSLCRLFPGVYYNFVCRTIEDTHKLLYTFKKVKSNNNNQFVSYRANNNTIKQIEHKKKEQHNTIQGYINVITTFINDYENPSIHDEKKKEIVDDFMKYLKMEMERLQELFEPDKNKLDELQMQLDHEPERKPNQTNEEYQKEATMLREKLQDEYNALEANSSAMEENLIRLRSIYNRFKQKGPAAGMIILKSGLATYRGKLQQSNINIKHFALTSRISEAMGHRSRAIRNVYEPKSASRKGGKRVTKKKRV
jgi:hypothetical protein